MIAELRLRLARWIIGKDGVILDARTGYVQLAETPDGNELTVDLSPQAVWREIRKQLVKDDHEA